MRWLLLKDLQILRRSPLLVALLVIYPVVISILVGFALSRGPEKPKVGFVNLVPPAACDVVLAGERIDACRVATESLFKAIDPVVLHSRAEAVQRVRAGDALGAVVIPADATRKLQTGLGSARVEVFYNAEDPVKARLVRDSIKSQVQDANNALTQRLSKVALQFLGLLVTGGEYSFLGRHFDVLGLRRSEDILREARADLPRDSPARDRVGQVIGFARLARDNLDLSGQVLASVGSPVRVASRKLAGSTTPLSSFAVAIAVSMSIMVITLLLAAGSLALEREENVFLRLVRGLVSRTGLLVVKAGLATMCSLAVSLLMLAGLGLFVDLEWSRFPLWFVGAAAGGLAFAAMGLAVGALTREVRAASLLAIMLALPLTFLALVPSGAVSPALFDVVRVVSAVFPFKPTLDAMNAALNDSGALGVPLLHLAGLSLAFAAASRMALRRFA